MATSGQARVGVYARKSTEQAGADADAKSVARQIENARAFATAKGWTVLDAHVYADDAVSGAEVKKLRDRQRLLDVIRTGNAPFQVLVMRDASRFSRRDGDEAFGELKRIAQAGVEIWFYQDGTRFEYGNFAANITGIVRAEMNAEFRRQIARWTREAMARKAASGYVTGGKVFGYLNERVNGHVERRINETEAVVVRRIYDLYAAGQGLSTIAHTLNAEGAARPRAQQGRVHGWCPSSVREILKRPLYRGEIVWGRAQKRDTEGQVRPKRRAQTDWLRIPAPDLRIVPAARADAVDARLASVYARALRRRNGQLMGRPPGEGSPYLLTGLLRCGVCGGGMEVLSSASGASRRFQYRCYVSRRKGAAVCANRLPAPLTVADRAVLDAVADTVLNPAVIERALAHAEGALHRESRGDQKAACEAELGELEKAIRRLTAAIASGGELPPLLDALRTHETRRAEVELRLNAMKASRPLPEYAAIRDQLESYLVDWRGLLTANVQQGQQVLRRLVKGRITFTPHPDGYYTFEGVGTVRPLLAGVVRNLASPTRLTQLTGVLRRAA